MPVQVGGYCYADNIAAGPAACTAFTASYTLQPDGSVRTMNCVSASPETGALKIAITTTPPAGEQTVAYIEQILQFPACTEQDKVDATLAIFGALLALAGVCFPGWLLIRWLNHNQREQT